MSKHPPTHEARIELFLALVEDYRELAEALPADPVMTLGGKRDPQDHWHRLLRAFALRKFTAEKDTVYLPTVAGSLEALLPPDQRGDGDFTTGMTKLLQKIEAGQIAFGVNQERAKTIVRDVLYGRYLHGDYDKWQRSTTRFDFIQEPAVWEWVTNVERFVFKLAEDLYRLREDGTLPYLDDATTEGANDGGPNVSPGE